MPRKNIAIIVLLLCLTAALFGKPTATDFRKVTIDGFGVNTTLSDIEARFGPPSRTEGNMWYWKDHLFTLGHSGARSYVRGMRLETKGRVIARAHTLAEEFGGLKDPHPEDADNVRNISLGQIIKLLGPPVSDPRGPWYKTDKNLHATVFRSAESSSPSELIVDSQGEIVRAFTLQWSK